MQTRPTFQAFSPLRGLMAAAVLATLMPGATAFGQLTNEMLIGDAVSEPNSPRYSDVENAIERYANRDSIAARTFLESAKRKNPKLPPVAVMMGKLHALAGNAQAVRVALDEVIEEAPDDPEPYLILAEDAVRNGRTIEADALYDKAVNLMESFEQNAKRKRDFQIRAYSGRTEIARRRRKWDQAKSDLDKLVKLDPENARAYLAMGQTYFMMDDPKVREGLSAFTKARELDESLDHPYVAAGKAFELQEKPDQSMKYFEGAYKNAPKEAGVQTAYSQALLRDGQIEKAESVLQRATSENADNPNLWLLRGVAARMKGDTSNAEQHLLRAISLSPANAVAYSQLALNLAESEAEEDKRRALGFAATSQKLAPKDADAAITLAWVLFENGQSRQASQLLQNLRMTNLDPDSTLLLAKILAKGGQKDGAKKLLARALDDKRHIFINRDEARELQASL